MRDQIWTLWYRLSRWAHHKSVDEGHFVRCHMKPPFRRPSNCLSTTCGSVSTLHYFSCLFFKPSFNRWRCFSAISPFQVFSRSFLKTQIKLTQKQSFSISRATISVLCCQEVSWKFHANRRWTHAVKSEQQVASSALSYCLLSDYGFTRSCRSVCLRGRGAEQKEATRHVQLLPLQLCSGADSHHHS